MHDVLFTEMLTKLAPDPFPVKITGKTKQNKPNPNQNNNNKNATNQTKPNQTTSTTRTPCHNPGNTGNVRGQVPASHYL